MIIIAKFDIFDSRYDNYFEVTLENTTADEVKIVMPNGRVIFTDRDSAVQFADAIYKVTSEIEE